MKIATLLFLLIYSLPFARAPFSWAARHTTVCLDNEISTLKVNGQCTSDTNGKANALNNYIKPVFTNEDLSHIPPTNSSRDPPIPNVTISAFYTQYQQSLWS